MKPASRSARLAAYFVDIVLIGIAKSIVSKMFPPLGNLATLTGVIYFCLMTYYEGATLGKKLFGIKVVAESGKLTWKSVLLRELLGKFVSGIALGLGFVWILFDKKRQGWHDKIGHTLVVEVIPLKGFKKIIAGFLATCMIVLPVILIIGFVSAIIISVTGYKALKSNNYPNSYLPTIPVSTP